MPLDLTQSNPGHDSTKLNFTLNLTQTQTKLLNLSQTQGQVLLMLTHIYTRETKLSCNVEQGLIVC